MLLTVYPFVIIAILACSLSQVLLKTSAGKKYDSRIFELLNPLVVLSYGVFFIALLVNIWAMSKGVQLKEVAILESLGYIFVPFLSNLFLKEQINRRTIFAIIVIVFGVLVFYS